jgi:hypothetical protein
VVCCQAFSPFSWPKSRKIHDKNPAVFFYFIIAYDFLFCIFVDQKLLKHEKAFTTSQESAVGNRNSNNPWKFRFFMEFGISANDGR